MTDMNNMLDKVQKLLALAIIVPEDVKDKFGEKFPKVGVANRMGVRHTGYDKDAYDSGYNDGRSSMRQCALEA